MNIEEIEKSLAESVDKALAEGKKLIYSSFGDGVNKCCLLSTDKDIAWCIHNGRDVLEFCANKFEIQRHDVNDLMFGYDTEAGYININSVSFENNEETSTAIYSGEFRLLGAKLARKYKPIHYSEA